MTCLLDRETFRRWERWFNGVAQKAMPEHYEMRDYENPYAKEIAAGKQLHPDPPPRPPKLEKAPKPKAPPSLDADEIEELQQAEADLKQVQRRVADNDTWTPDDRAEREKASARHRRLQQLWDKAEKAAEQARGLDVVIGEAEK